MTFPTLSRTETTVASRRDRGSSESCVASTPEGKVSPLGPHSYRLVLWPVRVLSKNWETFDPYLCSFTKSYVSGQSVNTISPRCHSGHGGKVYRRVTKINSLDLSVNLEQIFPKTFPRHNSKSLRKFVFRSHFIPNSFTLVLSRGLGPPHFSVTTFMRPREDERRDNRVTGGEQEKQSQSLISTLVVRV